MRPGRTLAVASVLALLAVACTDTDAPTAPSEQHTVQALPGTWGLGTGFRLVSISAGQEHTCGIDTTGRAYCWGENLLGRLGTNGQGDSHVPVPVFSELRFKAVSAGGLHTCGLTREGAAHCWGAGALGTSASGNTSLVPVAVDGGHRFLRIDAGIAHTCALTYEKEVYCWGLNSSGQLGDGTTGSRTAPAKVEGDYEFRSISAGLRHTCGVTFGGEAYCWGDNSDGQLGHGTDVQSSTPVLVGVIPSSVDPVEEPELVPLELNAISAGGAPLNQGEPAHSCGITRRGLGYCWGDNEYGQLGHSNDDDSNLPVRVGFELSITDDDGVGVTSHGRIFPVLLGSISAGGAHSCGVNRIGRSDIGSTLLPRAPGIWCWGLNSSGQLGDGTTASSDEPVFIWPISRTVVVTPGPFARTRTVSTGFESVSAGGQHTCALTINGEPYCWGLNASGQLGDGTDDNRNEPVPVEPPFAP